MSDPQMLLLVHHRITRGLDEARARRTQRVAAAGRRRVPWPFGRTRRPRVATVATACCSAA